MPEFIHRLNPALPVCWEDHRTLRLGFDRAEARITDPSAGTQRLVAALAEGIRNSVLTHTLHHLDATPSEWESLADVLGEAIVSVPARAKPRSTRLRVGVIGPDDRAGAQVVEALLDALARFGYQAGRFTDSRPSPHLVVITERYLEPLDAARRAAAGLPQLGIRFGDRSVAVGPLVSGEGRPCLGCVTMHDVERDPALPMLSAQLLGTVPASEGPAREIAAALAATFVRHWEAGSEMPTQTRLRIAVDRGLASLVPEIEHVTAHPGCGCAELTAR